MGDRSEPVRKYDVQRWNDAWERIRANQARAAEAVEEPVVVAAPEPTVTLSESAAHQIGRSLWYDITDDDCRLRATSPESLAAYLVRALFPPKP